MVSIADWVCRFGINEAHLKTLQDVIASLREELRDLEAERRVLSEKNCIVACKKTALGDHVATLEGQADRLENQVSSLTREKGVLASGQRQLARSWVDGSVARGNLEWM